MANLSKSEIIKSKPVEEGLDAFRNSFNATLADINELSDAVEHMHISDEGEMHRPDAKCILMYIGLKNLVIDLMLALQNLPAAHLLPSPNGRRVLRLLLSELPLSSENRIWNLSSPTSCPLETQLSSIY